MTASLCLALAASGAIALSGCGGGSQLDDFTLLMQRPEVHTVAVNANRLSHGDATYVEAKVTRDGKPYGIIFGQLTVKGLPGKFGRSDSIQIDQSEAVFQLKDGDIMVLGVSEYPLGGWKLKAEAPRIRAIIGGTGAYAGASGELITTRHGDGTYKQQFHFVGK